MKMIKLKPIRPNSTIATGYNAELKKALKELFDELQKEMKVFYESKTVAMDDMDDFYNFLKRFFLSKANRFELLGEKIAKYFVGQISRDTRDKLYRAAKGLITIKPDEDYKKIVLLKQALIQSNVNLIRELPDLLYKEINKNLTESLLSGNNLQKIKDELLEVGLQNPRNFSNAFYKSKDKVLNRAKFIARDQTLKATGLINNQRMVENGISKAIWRHSGGDKKPRLDHLRANGKIFETAVGMKLDDGFVFTGFLINCTCYAEPIIEI